MAIAAEITAFRHFFETFEAAGLRIQLEAPSDHAFYGTATTDEERHIIGRFVRGLVVDGEQTPVGRISRELGLVEGRPTVIQDVLRLAPQAKRRGFGGDLHNRAEEMYRRLGVVEVRADPQGDGSLFLARRGFQFDWPSYAKSSYNKGAQGEALMARVLYLMLSTTGDEISLDPIRELTERRPGPATILAEVERASDAGASFVAEFRQRQPSGLDDPSTHPERFATPQDIEQFARGVVLPGLPDGLFLGQAVMSGARWRGHKLLV